MLIFILVVVAGAIIIILAQALDKQHFQNRIKKKKEAIQIKTEPLKKVYSEIIQKIEIPKNCLRVSHLNETEIHKYLNLIWRQNEIIYFFPTIQYIDLYFMRYIGTTPLPDNIDIKFELVSIKIQDIIKFERDGEVYHENKISGGGGGGSSIGNALLGGIVAGGAGAIVASRKKTEAIKSELITHDNRVCRLVYIKDNIKRISSFNYEDYEVFKELMPEKDIFVIDEIRKRNVIDNHTIPQTDNIQKIRDFGALRDEGLLTQIEFEEKKKELLMNYPATSGRSINHKEQKQNTPQTDGELIQERLKKMYSEIRKKTEIPENCPQIYEFSSDVIRKIAEGLEPHIRKNFLHENTKNKILSGLNFIWIKDDSICFFPTIGCIENDCRDPKDIPLLFNIQSIKIQDIVHFTLADDIFKDDIFSKTKISGSGDGRSTSIEHDDRSAT